MKDIERTMEVPTDDDENVGDAPKKKAKKKKSKEERESDRKVVFWTFLIVLVITLFFWMLPRFKEIKFGWPSFNMGEKNSDGGDSEIENESGLKKEMKNYIEYNL